MLENDNQLDLFEETSKKQCPICAGGKVRLVKFVCIKCLDHFRKMGVSSEYMQQHIDWLPLNNGDFINERRKENNS